MVVISVVSAALARKMRVAMESGDTLQMMRTASNWRSHDRRMAQRQRALKTKGAQQRSFRIAGILQKIYTLPNLRSALAIYQKNGYKFIDDDHRDFVFECVLRHGREIREDICSYLQYVKNGDHWPLKTMAQMYAAHQRKNLKRFYHQKRIAMRKQAKYSNIWQYLSVEKGISSPYDEIEETQSHLTCEETGKSPINKRTQDPFKFNYNLILDNNKSRKLILDNVYVKLSLNKRLKLALLSLDYKYVEVLSKFKSKLDNFNHINSNRLIINNRFLEYVAQHKNCVNINKIIKYYNNLNNNIVNMAIPEMEEPTLIDNMTTDLAHNVVLTSAHTADSELIPEIPKWHQYTTEDVSGSYAPMVSRWNLMETIKWESNMLFNTVVKKYSLPYDIIHQASMQNSVSIRPFKNHLLWSGDMEIRVELNSNKFQFGQLQISWYYGADFDKHFKLRENIYSLSQCYHGLLDAGTSNSVVLNIPYKNQSPMLCMNKCTSGRDSYLGQLTIMVINPLTFTSGNPNYADISIYFKFNNCTFSGQLSADLAVPQMESALVMAGAMKLLDTVNSDSNRDNPPAVIPPQYIVPTASHSWSLATGGVDVLQPLRFNFGAQTRHPNNCDIDNYNSIYDIARTFSLVKVTKWQKSSQYGDNIMNLLIRPDLMTGSVSAKKLDAINSSALGTVASMFLQWRGSIEFKIDFVGTQFHTGRVMLAFIPGVTANVTLDQALSSYNASFDLQEDRSFTFTVPYVARDIWTRRAHMMDGVSPDYSFVGSLQAFVLNRLNCPNTVADYIYTNSYIRAGETMEFSVPIQPYLGLAYNREYKTESTKLIYPSDGMNENSYLSTWDGYLPINPVIRWGVLAGRVSEFPAGKYWLDPKFAGINMFWKSDRTFSITWVRKGKNELITKNVSTFCLALIDGIVVAIACADAKSAVLTWQAMCKRDQNFKNLTGIICDDGIKDNPWVGGSISLTQEILDMAEGEGRDASLLSLDATHRFISTNHGLQLFGERFDNLKDLCRRYQLYCNIEIPTQNWSKHEGINVRIPITPTGLVLDVTSARETVGVQNKIRDGIIPMILSAFKFFRGSIRFRIVIENYEHNIFVAVQHRPEILGIQDQYEILNNETDYMGVIAHGYATYIQSSDINNIVEIEVPFYQPGIYGLLGFPKLEGDALYTSLGSLFINFKGNKLNELKYLNCKVFYSLADDFNFNTFQGFPPMVDATFISSSYAKPEMMSFIMGKKIQEAKEEVTEVIAGIQEKILKGVDIAKRSIIAFIFGQLAHVLANFNIKSIAVAFGNICVQLGIAIEGFMEQITTIVTYVFNRFFTPSPTEQQSGDVEEEQVNHVTVGDQQHAIPMPKTRAFFKKMFAKPEDELEEKEIAASWLNFVYMAICAFCGIKKMKTPRSVINMAGEVFKTDNLRGANMFYTFIKNNFNLIRKIYHKIRRIVAPVYALKDYFDKQHALGSMWLKEYRSLTSISMTEDESFDPVFTERINIAEVMGRQLLELLDTSEGLGGRTVAAFERKYKRIVEIREELRLRGSYAFMRPKPLHLQFYGEPGIGKSALMEQVSDYVLKNVCKLRTIPINSMCEVKAGAKYWDTCTGKEPTLFFDDLWAQRTPNVLEAQLGAYIELYGTTVFSVPKAAVNEKHMRYAPQLILSTTNSPWVTIPDVVDQAVWRRMCMLIKVKSAPLDPEGHPDCLHCQGLATLETCDPDHLKDNHHLVFQLADKNRPNELIGGELTWLQFCAAMKNQLTVRYNNNMKMFAERSKQRIAMCELDESEDLESRWIAFEDEMRQKMLDEVNQEYVSIFTMNAGLQKYFNSRLDDLSEAYKLIFNRKKYADPEADDAVMQYSISRDEIEQMFDVPRHVIIDAIDKDNLVKQFQAIVRDYIIRTEKGDMRKIDMGDILKNLSSTYDNCLHCSERFNEHVTYFAGKLIYFNNTTEWDQECADGCILKTSLKMSYWIYFMNYSVIRKRALRRLQNNKLNSKLRVPPILHDLELHSTAMEKISDICADVRDYVKTLLLEDSILMRSLRKIGDFFKWLRDFCAEWLFVIMPIVTYFAAYKAYDKYFGTYNGEIRTYMGKVATEDFATRKATAVLAIERDIMSMSSEERRQFIETNYHDIMMTRLPAMPQSSQYDPLRGDRPHTYTGVAKVPMMAKAQEGPQQVSVAEARLRKNAVWIRANYVDSYGFTRTAKFMCLQIRGRQLLVVRHYWERWVTLPRETTYTFSYVENTERIKHLGIDGIPINLMDLPTNHLYYEKNEDGSIKNDCNWTIIDLPHIIPYVKDLVKFIARAPQHRYVVNDIIFVRPGESSVQLPLIKSEHTIYMEPIGDGSPLEMRKTYAYNKHAAGYCGSCILSPNLEQPIVGMHVAAYQGYGHAEPLYAEAFDTEPTVKKPVVDIAEMVLEPADYANIDLDTVLYPKGCVPPAMAAKQSDESSLVPSIFHGDIYEVLTEPMPLSSKDPRANGIDPMKLGAEKHGLFSRDFLRADLIDAREDLEKKIITHCRPTRSDVGVLDLQTAICGDVNLPNYTPLNWSSSEGFPLSMQRPHGTSGKMWLFDMELTTHGYNLKGLHPEFKRIYDVQLNGRKRGIKQTVIYVDCKKDTTGEISKARTPGKTRVFQTAPVQYVVTFRQYFGDFLAAYKSKRVEVEHGIGINVDSAEWTTMARYLQSKGKYLIAGDYSHFGYTLNSEVMRECFDIMINWYQEYSNSETLDEDQRVRSILAEEAINCEHLCGNFVYSTLCGMASGFPATDVLNSLVNCVYIRLAWKEITGKSLYYFNKHCNALTYGDDVLINVSDEYIETYNTQSVHDFFQRYNIKFTDCTKDGKIIKYRTFDDAPFLKRNFIKHPTRPGMYLAKIDEMSIGNCLNWVIKKDNPTEAMQSNALSALELAFGHGPEYYNRLRTCLERKFREIRVNFSSKDWHSMDSEKFDAM